MVPTDLKLLIAGGCHIIGYPVGATTSFSEVAVSMLRDRGVNASVSLLPYLKLTHSRRLERFLKANYGDYLILQLGHAESHRTLKQWFHRGFKGRFGHGIGWGRTCDNRLDGNSDSSGKSSKASMKRPFETFGSRVRWRVRAIAKWLLDSAIGCPLVDRSDIASEFDRIMAIVLKYFEARQIVVLLPLPCADPTIARYRAMISGEMEVICRARGIRALDVSTESGFTNSTVAPYAVYLDSLHLSEVGHRIVGEAVTREVCFRLHCIAQ
jgi:hypothetical protein